MCNSYVEMQNRHTRQLAPIMTAIRIVTALLVLVCSSVYGQVSNPVNQLTSPLFARPVWIAPAPSGSAPIGISGSGSVGTASAAIIAAGQFSSWLTIQNTSTAATLYVSFNATTTTVNGFVIAPGGALTLPTGTSNALTGLASAAATTFAIIGY